MVLKGHWNEEVKYIHSLHPHLHVIITIISYTFVCLYKIMHKCISYNQIKIFSSSVRVITRRNVREKVSPATIVIPILCVHCVQYSISLLHVTQIIIVRRQIYSTLIRKKNGHRIMENFGKTSTH